MTGTSDDQLVSVVLPTLNGERYIAASIESCLAQTYGLFELIVVDDGSTDGTVDVVRTFSDPRIRLVRLTENVGLPAALNRGFAEARGGYLTFTSDDNLYAPEAFATMLAALQERPEVGMVYAGQMIIDAAGSVVRPANLFPPEALAWTNPVGGCFLYRRSVAQAVGEYDPRFAMAEDAHYWLRVSRRAQILQLPGRLYYYRLHSESLTGRGYGAYEAMRAVVRARREVLGLGSREYRRQVAAAYAEEAFAAFQRRDFGHVRRSLLRALLRDPRRLARRGVISIARRSLTQRA
jgi:glycosyltransferase involved in cell wall biosynthesis